MYKLGTMLIFWGIALEVLFSFAAFMYIVICTVASIPAQHNECVMLWFIASVVCTVMVCAGANLVKSNETN
jgi:hypothetical protein